MMLNVIHSTQQISDSGFIGPDKCQEPLGSPCFAKEGASAFAVEAAAQRSVPQGRLQGSCL